MNHMGFINMHTTIDNHQGLEIGRQNPRKRGGEDDIN